MHPLRWLMHRILYHLDPSYTADIGTRSNSTVELSCFPFMTPIVAIFRRGKHKSDLKRLLREMSVNLMI